MLKIGINGAAGRMGTRIAALAIDDSEVEICAAIDHEKSSDLGKDIGILSGKGANGIKVLSDLKGICDKVDSIIEFTLPDATMEHLQVCCEVNVPMVIGTTGLTPDQVLKIKEASKKIPIVFSPNMAVGVNMLFKLVAEAARVLYGNFDVKVDETHHVHKKDSPSGTAKKIAEMIVGDSGYENEDVDIEAFREGEVVGNHGIKFDSEFETLEIRHNAKNRDVFAAGAITAAKFVKDKDPGLYSMFDVLGI